MKSTLLTLTTAALLTLTASAQHAAHPAATTAASSAIKNIFWQPDSLKQGSPAFFTVELERPAVRVTGSWVNKTLTFFKTGDPKLWYALAGDDVETQPGSFRVSITATLAGGRIARSTKQVDIAAANFTTGTANVAEDFVEPNAEEQKQIAADNRLKARAYTHFLSQPQWSGSFVKPVKAESTPSFGETRVLNEEKTSEHRGTDFPVSEGSPVEASNSGTVVLADEMFYEGNCVIIDHGQHFFTIYMHLSKPTVKVGDKVHKGERIGISGKTGRVTGPHLHFGVRWNGAYLDPVELLSLTLPTIPANERDKAPSVRTAVRR
ncbi:MAG TPA: M23 family metallopeptidase [Acidobacteriaceae bacterium]